MFTSAVLNVHTIVCKASSYIIMEHWHMSWRKSTRIWKFSCFWYGTKIKFAYWQSDNFRNAEKLEKGLLGVRSAIYHCWLSICLCYHPVALSHHDIPEVDNEQHTNDEPRGSITNGISLAATSSASSLQSCHTYDRDRPSVIIHRNIDRSSIYPTVSSSTMNTSSVSDFVYMSTSSNIIPWSGSNQNTALPTGTIRQNTHSNLKWLYCTNQ